MILEFNPNANFYFVSLDFKDKGYTSFKKNITKLFLDEIKKNQKFSRPLIPFFKNELAQLKAENKIDSKANNISLFKSRCMQKLFDNYGNQNEKASTLMAIEMDLTDMHLYEFDFIFNEVVAKTFNKYTIQRLSNEYIKDNFIDNLPNFKINDFLFQFFDEEKRFSLGTLNRNFSLTEQADFDLFHEVKKEIDKYKTD